MIPLLLSTCELQLCNMLLLKSNNQIDDSDLITLAPMFCLSTPDKDFRVRYDEQFSGIRNVPHSPCHHRERSIKTYFPRTIACVSSHGVIHLYEL